MRRWPAIVALCVAASGCAQAQEERQAAQVNIAQAEGPVPRPAASPVLLRLLPPERGGPNAYPEAIVSGVLDLTEECVRLQAGSGQMPIVVSAPGAALGRDAAGLYIQSRGQQLRHGSSVTGGGGWFTDLPTLGQLEQPVPAACRSGPFVIVTGMERFDPKDQPTPRSPPPPPVVPERG